MSLAFQQVTLEEMLKGNQLGISLQFSRSYSKLLSPELSLVTRASFCKNNTNIPLIINSKEAIIFILYDTHLLIDPDQRRIMSTQVFNSLHRMRIFYF